MRIVVPSALLAACLLLAGCRGSELYTHQDLVQVRQTYAELLPIYKAFKKAFKANQTAGILRGFRIEHGPCAVVDQIDNRDTIDPNVNLFQASITLDDLCNAIEAGYVEWAMKAHYPYPKRVQPLRPSEVFIGADGDLEKMGKYLRNPSALA
jgi:hypothetical protein